MMISLFMRNGGEITNEGNSDRDYQKPTGGFTAEMEAVRSGDDLFTV